jgi:hypothetical protein
LKLGKLKEELTPILNKLVSAFNPEDTIDLDFWKSIYKTEQGYGRFKITGWILKLFPKISSKIFVESWKDFGAGLSSVPFIWDYFGTTLKMKFVGGFRWIRN